MFAARGTVILRCRYLFLVLYAQKSFTIINSRKIKRQDSCKFLRLRRDRLDIGYKIVEMLRGTRQQIEL